MAKYNKYLPLWIGDYLRDTSHLTIQRHGVYFLLIMHYWANHKLPKNRSEINIVAGAHKRQEKADVAYILDHYFEPDGSHKRLDESLSQSRVSYEKRVFAQAESVKARMSK